MMAMKSVNESLSDAALGERKALLHRLVPGEIRVGVFDLLAASLIAESRFLIVGLQRRNMHEIIECVRVRSQAMRS